MSEYQDPALYIYEVQRRFKEGAGTLDALELDQHDAVGVETPFQHFRLRSGYGIPAARGVHRRRRQCGVVPEPCRVPDGHLDVDVAFAFAGLAAAHDRLHGLHLLHHAPGAPCETITWQVMEQASPFRYRRPP